jgi:hypothetical protein
MTGKTSEVTEKVGKGRARRDGERKLLDGNQSAITKVSIIFGPLLFTTRSKSRVCGRICNIPNTFIDGAVSREEYQGGWRVGNTEAPKRPGVYTSLSQSFYHPVSTLLDVEIIEEGRARAHGAVHGNCRLNSNSSNSISYNSAQYGSTCRGYSQVEHLKPSIGHSKPRRLVQRMKKAAFVAPSFLFLFFFYMKVVTQN